VKGAQNQSLGEKWAATSKRLRSTALNYVQHIFPEGQKFCRGQLPPLRYPWLRTW